MADLEIPEGELFALAGELRDLAEEAGGLAGAAENLAGAVACMPGGESGVAASGCGQAVDLRASQHAGRVTNHASDIGDLDGEFTSLDAYHEQQFTRPFGSGQQPV